MTKDIQVKNFKIIYLKRPLDKNIRYEIYVRAITKEDALEQALSRIGSKHKIARRLLKLHEIKEINENDLKNPILKEIAKNDKVKILTNE